MPSLLRLNGMSWIRSIGFLGLILVLSCRSNEGQDTPRIQPKNFLITVDDLQSIMHSDTVKLLDLQTPEDYHAGHIPEAVNIWRSAIQNDSFPYRGMIGSKAHIEEVFQSRGIESDDFLVLYDNRASCEATRLWWVLDAYGFDRLAILDGGIAAWHKQNPVSQEEVQVDQGSFTLPKAFNAQKLATLAEVKQRDLSSTVLVDTRSIAEYTGEEQKKGAMAGGRIPGSLHLDWVETMNPDQTFLSVEDLTEKISTLGIQPDQEVIVYCHSGVRSAHVLFVLTELLDFERVKNYDGSWVEWTYENQSVAKN